MLSILAAGTQHHVLGTVMSYFVVVPLEKVRHWAATRQTGWISSFVYVSVHNHLSPYYRFDAQFFCS